MRGYDYDLPLYDALGDCDLSAYQRVLAGTMIGGLDTAGTAASSRCVIGSATLPSA